MTINYYRTVYDPLKVMGTHFFYFIALNIFFVTSQKHEHDNISIKHLPYYVQNIPKLKDACLADQNCPYSDVVLNGVCWGYEKNCSMKNSYSSMSCPGHHKGWVQTKREQIETFHNQADFGYVKQQRASLKNICSDGKGKTSSLQCTENLEFCVGRNIMIDLTDLAKRKDPVRYHMDVLKQGQISGNCRLDKELLKNNTVYISPLQSWAPELRFFGEAATNFEENCDVWVTKPAIITKIDASVNMYHHFCDFFNLYASQHVNTDWNGSFSTDTQVLIWESYPYRSNFGVTWKAFTQNPIWTLDALKGKKVCFKNLMLPLLPRMIFGLYYNTPVIWGCEKSGLFHAFSHHVLHRLGIKQALRTSKIHVTLLSRKTKYRRILNEEELLRALDHNDNFVVRKVEFTHSDPFVEQLKQDQWTDILIGMHGSGLTHTLFLPDWAVLFELYDCGDPDCYRDLTRLRGVKYITWEDSRKMDAEDEGHHPNGGTHEKFTNYNFDAQEFIRLVNDAASHVRKHPQWQKTAIRRNHEEL